MSNKKTEPTDGPSTWRWRIAKTGKTAREFADYAGIHNTKLSQYINGKIQPEPARISHVEKCLKRLGA